MTMQLHEENDMVDVCIVQLFVFCENGALHQNISYRMNGAQQLTQGFLQELYTGTSAHQGQPILQILGFQNSEHNPKQITIRLSDGTTFFDAALIGPYDLTNGKIKVSPFSAYHGTMEFGKLDIVKIADFFSKIDMTKICRLKMMIRKITHIRTADRKTGRPQELAFYMQANQLAPEADIPIQTPADPDPTPHNNINISTNDPPIKICEEDDPPLGKEGTQPAASQANLQAAKGRTVAAINKELQILGICKDRNPDEPLTYREIMNGYDGFFIGRLLRLKHTNKQGKEGSIPMLSLGFIDSAGEMLKMNLLGKMAVREEKQLKLGRCYYLKGLQVVQVKGSSYVKLRQKDYKLHALNQQTITSKFPQQYYHWEHEHDYIQNENVDVAGVVQDVEEKTFYGVKSVGDSKEAKEVIRVVIRNRFKTVKVSFWSDQLKNLLRFNLKKGEVVLLTDVRKKKLVFLDYSTQSTLTKLEPGTPLYQTISQFLPEQVQYPTPINVQSLYNIQSLEKFNTRVHLIYAYLARVYDDKMLFKYCDLCKKKININSPKCFQCKNNVTTLKYNTNVEFSDYSGSLLLSVYDNIAEKLFGHSALAMKEMKDNREEYDKFMDVLAYQPFLIGVEIKSQRFILRTVEPVVQQEMIKWCQENIKNILKINEKCAKLQPAEEEEE